MCRPDSNDGCTRPQAHGGDPNAFAVRGTAPRQSDAAMLRLLAAGDQRALEVLYRRHWRNVRDFIRSQYSPLGEQAAEDIASETFLRIWQRRRGLGTLRNVCSHLRGVARSVMVDCWRRRALNVGAELPADFPSPLHGPDVLMERDESGQQFDRAMGALPESHRTALELSTFMGLPAKDIARLLGCTPNAARRILQKARAKFSRVASRCGDSCVMNERRPEECPAREGNCYCLKWFYKRMLRSG